MKMRQEVSEPWKKLKSTALIRFQEVSYFDTTEIFVHLIDTAPLSRWIRIQSSDFKPAVWQLRFRVTDRLLKQSF